MTSVEVLGITDSLSSDNEKVWIMTRLSVVFLAII